MELNRHKLAIGPLFIRSDKVNSPSSEIESLGLSLELATAKQSFRTPLFRKVTSYNPTQCGLTDILIFGDNCPCEFNYLPIFSAQSDQGLFVPLESFLVGLYQEFEVSRSIFAVLTELREMIEFAKGGVYHFQPLIPTVATLGFAVTSILSFGRTLQVDIDWIPPQDRVLSQRKLQIDAAAIDFHPLPDGTLGEGKWLKPKDCFTRVLLCAELRKIVPGSPINLFTDVGKTELISKYEWTPLARMSNKQAREARVQYICQHPELVADPKALALSLQKAGLYSENTTSWQIEKYLPSLIAQAKNVNC